MKDNTGEKGKVNNEKERIKGDSPGNKMQLICLVVIGVIFSLWIFSHSQANIRYKKLPDGVEHWYWVRTGDEKPWFFQQLENIFDVLLPRRDKLPFGKSVTFLIGVGEYKYLSPQLPFVNNDLQDMRQFLLAKGGFDEVYVASNKVVKRYLIEKYMKNNFPRWLSREDRLLFYYSGHGADAEGSTGYMQFSNAKASDFTGDQILPIKDVTYWCDEIKINHLLFIFDCCASGLAFTPKGVTGNELQQMLTTISRNGSRTIIAAGTAEEQTFEVRRPGGKGNGIFTGAFLNALETGMTDKGKDGFLTVDEIFARTKDEVNAFASRYKKKLTPRLWPYDEGNYRGTFIFINPDAKKQNIILADAYSNAIAATPIPKGKTVATFGVIRLISNFTGDVYIDDKTVDKIESGEIKDFNVLTGEHKVVVRTKEQIFTKSIDVTQGKTQAVIIRAETPIPSKPKETTQTRPFIPLFRSTPKELSKDDVKEMLIKHDFFDSDWNKDSRGFDNQFAIQTIQNDKVVFDNASGLMWQQGGSLNYMTYDKAKEWIQELNRNRYAGFNDWRLPTLEEAMSLMEPKELNGNLYIDPVFDSTQWWIWTADLFQGESRAWVVSFGIGYCDWDSLDDSSYVRAVRSGQSSSE